MFLNCLPKAYFRNLLSFESKRHNSSTKSDAPKYAKDRSKSQYKSKNTNQQKKWYPYSSYVNDFKKNR